MGNTFKVSSLRWNDGYDNLSHGIFTKGEENSFVCKAREVRISFENETLSVHRLSDENKAEDIANTFSADELILITKSIGHYKTRWQNLVGSRKPLVKVSSEPLQEDSPKGASR